MSYDLTRFYSLNANLSSGYVVYSKLSSSNGTIHAAAVEPGSCIKGAHAYTRAEVKRHKTLEDGVWVTYKCGVYDVTKYMDSHIGGRKKLMGAAGADIAPCYDHIPGHRRQRATDDLESMRIGNVKEVAAAKGML